MSSRRDVPDATEEIRGGGPNSLHPPKPKGCLVGNSDTIPPRLIQRELSQSPPYREEVGALPCA